MPVISNTAKHPDKHMNINHNYFALYEPATYYIPTYILYLILK
jgi:hypothetical protein